MRVCLIALSLLMAHVPQAKAADEQSEQSDGSGNSEESEESDTDSPQTGALTPSTVNPAPQPIATETVSESDTESTTTAAPEPGIQPTSSAPAPVPPKQKAVGLEISVDLGVRQGAALVGTALDSGFRIGPRFNNAQGLRPFVGLDLVYGWRRNGETGSSDGAGLGLVSAELGAQIPLIEDRPGNVGLRFTPSINIGGPLITGDNADDYPGSTGAWALGGQLVVGPVFRAAQGFSIGADLGLVLLAHQVNYQPQGAQNGYRDQLGFVGLVTSLNFGFIPQAP